MSEFLKQAFIVLLCFSGSLATKSISLDSEPCLARFNLIDLNPDKHSITFSIKE